MAWPPPLLIASHPAWWSLDATLAGVDPDDLAALPWDPAFALEAAAAAGEAVNTTEDRQVGHVWLRDPASAPSVLLAQEIQDAIDHTVSLAASIRRGEVTDAAGEPFTDVLHIGVGGSLLGPRLLVSALGDGPDGASRGLRVHVVDNIDPNGLHRVVGRIGARIRSTLVVVVSKSGTTSEPLASLALVRAMLEEHGLDAASRLVAVTTPDSPLADTARAEGWLAVLPLWSWVGGRFGTLSPAGLFTAALAGLDAASLLAGAAAMDAWTAKAPPLDNPAAVLAGVWYLLGHGRGDRNLVVLPYLDRLHRLGRWLQQVVMESVGKAEDRDGKPVQQGLTVFGTKGSTDQHAYVQQLRDGRDDAIVLFIQTFDTGVPALRLDAGNTAGDALQGFMLGTRRALAQTGRPSLTLSVGRLDEHALGSLIALFERAVALYAGLIGVNAFDQPGVEAGKREARALLELGRRIEAALVDGPATVRTLAARLDADPLETLWLLHRRAARGAVVAQGDPATDPWSLPS